MAKPSVDGLEEKLGDTLAVTRVNIGDEDGHRLAAKYQVRGVPAFLLLSPDGEVVYRKVGGPPDVERVEAELATLR